MSDEQLSIEEAEAAAGNNDTVTQDELQEMHKDANLNEIEDRLAYEQEFADAQQSATHVDEEPRFAARQGRKTYHTGPKGVRTDFEEAKLKLRAKRIQGRIQKTKKVYMQFEDDNSAIESFKLIDNNHNSNKQTQPSTKELRRETGTETETNGNSTSSKNKKNFEVVDEDDLAEDELKAKEEREQELDDEESLDDHDEAILYQYKMQRIQTIEAHRPRFGTLKECNVVSFQKQVELAPKNIITIMHVYQDYLERCVQLNKCLAILAHAYLHVQFLRARSDRIGLTTYPDIGLPTMIVWKNGEQVSSFVAVLNEIGNPFNVHDVENFLIGNKFIQKSVVLADRPDLQNSSNSNSNSNGISGSGNGSGNGTNDDATWNNNKTVDLIRKRMKKNKIYGNKALSANVNVKNNCVQSRKFGANDESSDSELDID